MPETWKCLRRLGGPTAGWRPSALPLPLLQADAPTLVFRGPEDLSGVSPVVCSNVTSAPAKPWAPDTTLPGISPPVLKEKQKKKKLPEILKSELDEWAAAMNAEFEAAEQFDLLIE